MAAGQISEFTNKPLSSILKSKAGERRNLLSRPAVKANVCDVPARFSRWLRSVKLEAM